jgi:DNA repair exonuclease SbcCD ATPase subunit
MKIKFQQAIIDGFRGIVNQLIFDLDRPGLNLIKGVNGTKKTTLFESVVWCLFGTNLKETNQDKVASWEEIRPSNWKGTRVITYFEVDGEDYSIARHLDYKGDTNGLKGNDSLMLWKNNEQLFPGINKDETQERINKLLGTDPKTFMNSVMFGQRMARLITQDNKDKRALFEQLFDVEWVNICKHKAELDLTEKNQNLSKIISEADTLNSQITMAEATLVRDKRLCEEWGQNQANKISDCESNIKGFETLITNYNNELKVVVPPLDYDKEEHDKIEQEYNELTSTKNKYRLDLVEIDNDQKRIQSEIDNNNYRINQFTARINQIKKEIEENKGIVKESIVKGLCPVCHQAINQTNHANIEKIYSTANKEAEAEIEDLNTQILELNNKLLQLTQALDDVTEGIKRVKNDITTTNDRYNVVAARYQELNNIENTLFEIVLLENEKIRLKSLQNEKAPDFNIASQGKAITLMKIKSESLNSNITDLQEEIKIIKWWSEKGFGASGIKAFIFNAMLAQLNENTRKYGERLGISIEFAIDLTKSSKPFTTICSLGDKLNKDYKEFSGGEKQRLDIVLIFAMYDLISINTDINLLIMDEVFDGLDEDGENAVFDLIRMKADEGKSVYVISHSSTLDNLYANTINFTKENNNLILN